MERSYGGKFSWHERLVAMKQIVNASTRDFAKEYSVPCIDAEVLSDDGALFYDITHLNLVGCEVVGDLIAKELLRQSHVGLEGKAGEV